MTRTSQILNHTTVLCAVVVVAQNNTECAHNPRWESSIASTPKHPNNNCRRIKDRKVVALQSQKRTDSRVKEKSVKENEPVQKRREAKGNKRTPEKVQINGLTILNPKPSHTHAQEADGYFSAKLDMQRCEKRRQKLLAKQEKRERAHKFNLNNGLPVADDDTGSSFKQKPKTTDERPVTPPSSLSSSTSSLGLRSSDDETEWLN